MQISPKEVEEIKVIGTLHGADVKLVKTRGGFNIAVGKKKKSGKKDEPLAAGSHEGIVAHQIEKQFGVDFKPAMYKSEAEAMPDIVDLSYLLSKSDKEKGLELYTSQKFNDIEFILYKHGYTLGKYNTTLNKNSLEVVGQNLSPEYINNSSEETQQALAKAMYEVVKELNLDGVVKK
jgi:hypothetical protein